MSSAVSNVVYYGRDVNDKTTQYAKDVLKGVFLVGREQKLACKRHIDNLEQSKSKDFDFYFDVAEAEKTFNLFEKFKFTDGEVAGQYIKLVPFQNFIIGSLYGWKNKQTHYRRYTKSYIELARKNAKSLLNSGIAIKHTAFDDYPNAQGYCAATKKDQAKLVWKMCDKTIKMSKGLRKRSKSYEREGTIQWVHNGATIKALGRDTSTIDGFNPHIGIIDEYHEHRTGEAVSQLEEGTTLQVNQLISIITTAGKNLNSPCKREHDYAVRIVHGLIENETYFTFIAQMDKDDSFDDETKWVKSNPLLPYVPQSLPNIRQLYKQAKEKGGDNWVTFLTKNLNVWYEYKSSEFINLEKFKRCESDIKLEEMKGLDCYVGLDLSSGGDLTSISLLFELENNEYYIYSHSFMPVERLEEHEQTDKAPYRKWVTDKLITLTDGVSGFKTDYKYIIRHLLEIKDRYGLKIKAIGYDPHNASSFLADLEVFDCDCISISQSAKNLNEPTVDFQLTVDEQKLKYDKKSSLFVWSVANATLSYNSFEECKIEKRRRENRIDAVDSTICAWKVMFEDRNREKTLNEKIQSEGVYF